jgi:NCAIR mutase (PurE)-related protein
MTSPDAAPDNPLHEHLLTLDEMESLREEMADLGAATAADLDARGDEAAAEVAERLREMGLTSLADLDARIAALHRLLDTLEATAPPPSPVP